MSAELKRFKKWAMAHSKNDTLLAHFYVEQKKEEKSGKVMVKKIIDPPDYFIFNLLSKDKCWQVKGTLGHGKCGEKYYVPVLNCWKIDETFYKALKEYYNNQHEEYCKKYKYAVIFSKNALTNIFGSENVVEVRNYKGESINSKNCWHFDVPVYRYGALRPFSFCKVIRIRIPKHEIIGEPIFRIPPKAVVGVMVPYGTKQGYRTLLAQKGMAHVCLFGL